MNSSINIVLTKIKLKLNSAFSAYENDFKLKVEINDKTETANVNGALFITYKGEKVSENLTKNNKLFFLKRYINIEILGVIKENNKTKLNDYIDLILNEISGLKTADGLGINYIMPSSISVIEQDEYENYRFKVNVISPIDFNFNGEIDNVDN